MRFSLPCSASLALIVAFGLAGCDTAATLKESLPPLSSSPPYTGSRHAPSVSTGATARDPNGPIPWQQYRARESEPFVSEGTGEFMGRVPAGSTARGSNAGDTITLNLVNAPIAHAARTVLGEILKLNYTVSERVTGTVTLQTTSAVSRDAVLELFETALRSSGSVIVRSGDFYQIVPAQNAAQAGLPLARDGQRTSIGAQVRPMPLRHIGPADAKRLLDPVVPQGTVVRLDESRNMIVLSGTQRELQEYADLLAVFDIDWMKGMSFALFPVRTTDPEAIAKELETVLGIDKDGPLKGAVRVVPNRRLNSVLVISPRRQHIETARAWIARLDHLAEDSEEQLHVYKIQNRSATELATLLSRMLRGRDTTATTGRGPVAPRYEAATTGPLAPASGTSVAGRDGPSLASSGLRQSGGFGATAGAFDRESAPAVSETAGSSGAPADNERDARNKVVADEANNALLITATPKEYRRILSMLHRLDVLPTQVMLEALIAEVTLNDELKFGLKWFFDKGRSSFTLTDAANGAVGSVFPGFSYFFSAPNVKIALDAVSGITKVNVVSAPSLMVLDNRRALLQVGDQVPIVTQSAQNLLNNGGAIVNSISLRDTGVILAITPRVNDAGRVLLDIEQEVSSVARTTSSGIDSPTIQQRRIRTTVVVADGEVLALGGLIQERDLTSKTQVPILGDLPLLGPAFRQKTDRIDRTELVIFIRPLVVRNSGEARAVTDEWRSRIDLQPPASKAGRDRFDRDLKRIIK